MDEYWQEEIVSPVPFYENLCFINCDLYTPGKIHPILQFDTQSVKDNTRFPSKLKFLCGPYVLQTNRQKFNKAEIDPTCMLCGESEETLEHFRKAFFTSSDQSRYILWSCQNVCDALSYLLDNIYIRFGTKLYRQIVGIPMGTNCVPLVADLFLYCYERDFMDSLNHDNQADVIEAFNSTSRYLDDLLNIDNPYFEGMVNQIYPPELQLNKANISDTEAPFLDLHLSVANGFISSKNYDKFDFDIVNFSCYLMLD